MIGGGDFIKTSTGKVQPAATLPVTLVMLEAVRDFHELTGARIGVKAAGGIRTAKDAVKYLVVVHEVAGPEWLHARPVPLRRLVAAQRRADAAPQAAHRPLRRPRLRDARLMATDRDGPRPRHAHVGVRARRPRRATLVTIEPSLRAVHRRRVRRRRVDGGRVQDRRPVHRGGAGRGRPTAGPADVDAAVAAARRALHPVVDAARRRSGRKYLYRIARTIQERSRELAVLESIDNGKPIKETRDVDLPLVAAHFFYYAGWADKLA